MPPRAKFCRNRSATWRQRVDSRRLRQRSDRGHQASTTPPTPYDIVFMDWRMPGMDGLQASRHIKSDETLKHPPRIVLVTAFGREEVREEAERLHSMASWSSR